MAINGYSENHLQMHHMDMIINYSIQQLHLDINKLVILIFLILIKINELVISTLLNSCMQCSNTIVVHDPWPVIGMPRLPSQMICCDRISRPPLPGQMPNLEMPGPAIYKH